MFNLKGHVLLQLYTKWVISRKQKFVVASRIGFFLIVKKTILWQLQTDSSFEFIFIYIISSAGTCGWFRFDHICSLICSNLSNINCRLLNSNSLTTVRDDAFSGLPHLEYLWVVLLNSLFIKKKRSKHVGILIHDYIFSFFLNYRYSLKYKT